ncbi:MAG: formylglycine-generating enzyme family protein [bacterium]|nr:formylglycine-generating enzyme family protein [bacterium]
MLSFMSNTRRMRAICYTCSLLLFQLLIAVMPNRGTAQSSPVADYIANYYEMLNNLGDANMDLSDRRLFRSELLNQYFLFDGSLLWNDLRPQGSQYIRPQEYLDNILTDFPRGVSFSYSGLKVGPLLPDGGSLKTVLQLLSEVRPVGRAVIRNEVQIVLTVQEFSANAISARIKSINKADQSPAPSNEAQPEPQNTGPTPAELEAAAWQRAERLDNIDGYEAYLSDYPAGQNALGARLRLKELRKLFLPLPIQDLERNMVRVEGGSFRMGCTGEQWGHCHEDEEPTHRVKLNTYRISKYEVTQAQWEAVMGTTVAQQRDKSDKDWSLFGVGGDYPMYYVSWEEANEFIGKLNRMTGGSYRLPTEAEWEYAARGGSRSRRYIFSGSNNLGSVGWYVDNSGNKTHAVGQKSANELGLYGMSGNVWEWCSDWYESDYYSSSPRRNPKGLGTGTLRVLRGGSWDAGAGYCRVSNRHGSSSSFRDNYLGFRLAASP